MTRLATSVALATALALAAAPRLAAADDTVPTPRSENTALLLSLGGTAASVAMVAGGASAEDGDLVMFGLASSLVTPSLGEWYAGKYLTLGMGLRAASAVATVAGLAQVLSCIDACDDGSSSDNSGGLLLGAGLVGYAAGTLYDIATAPSAARAYNARHGLRVSVTPTLVPSPSGPVAGVGLGGSF